MVLVLSLLIRLDYIKALNKQIITLLYLFKIISDMHHVIIHDVCDNLIDWQSMQTSISTNHALVVCVAVADPGFEDTGGPPF